MSDLFVMVILYFSKIECVNILNIFSPIYCEYQIKKSNLSNWEGGRVIEDERTFARQRN